jgi:hypothetical protein
MGYVVIPAVVGVTGAFTFFAVWLLWRLGMVVRRKISPRKVQQGRLPKSLVLALVLGTIAFGLGMAIRNFDVFTVLAIYPGSFIFYIIPVAITDFVPEPALFLAGGVGAILFWAGVVLLGIHGLRWLRRGNTHAPSVG